MPENQPKKRSLEFFSATDLDNPNTNKLAASDPSKLKVKALTITSEEGVDMDAFVAGNTLLNPHLKSSSFGFEDCGLHVAVVEFAPGLVVPLHSHSQDCIYYIERGSVIMGSREFGPGEGFLTRANQAYGFRIGAEGLRLLEFAAGPHLDVHVADRNLGSWKEKIAAAVNELAH